MLSFLSSYPEVNASEVDGKTYDYIVVGGGTGGCVVASRLSEDPSVSVLVIERGRVGDSLLSRVPLISQDLAGGKGARQVVADRYTEPIAHVGGRREKLWSAWGLGGASRINAMILTRGPPADYNGWADGLGLADWSFERVEPYFRRIENAVAHPDSEARGHGGPIDCRQFDTPFEWGPYLNKAAQAIGLPLAKDANDPTAPAMGIYTCDVALDGSSRRRTAYHAYLNKQIALERRDRLTVCTGAVASRLDVDGGAGVVRGVYVRPAVEAARPGSTKGADFYVRARREVIVSCSGLVTPQLLMLSGLGPRAHLEAHGIPVVRDLPRVGAALADHYAVPIQLDVPVRESLSVLMATALAGLWHMLLWVLLGRGIMRHGSNVNTIFARTGAIDDETLTVRARDPRTGADNMDAARPANVPDVEVMIMPCNCFKWPVPGSFLTFYACLVQPFSRGRVELDDADPLSHPKVTHPMFRDLRDLAPARKAVRFAMRLADAFQKSGYPYDAPLAFAPGNNPERLAEATLIDDPDWVHPAQMPAVRVAESLSPTIGEKEKEEEMKEEVVVIAPSSKSGGKTWATVTDAEIDDYISTVATLSLHTACTCPISLDDATGVVDQRLLVHGLRNLRLADTSVFPSMPSSHTMLPTIMVGERCADFIRETWSAKDKTV